MFNNVTLNATPLIQTLDTILLRGGESSKGGKHCIVFNEYALNLEDSGVKTRDQDPSRPSRYFQTMYISVLTVVEFHSVADEIQ